MSKREITSTKRKNKGISLKKVSQLAGVSQATASRILNNNPNYSYAQETIDKVVKISEENGYRTSQLYKSLFGGKTMSAGVIFPSKGFYNDIIQGIHDRLLESGHAMVMGFNQNNMDNPENSVEKKIIQRLNEHRVDGFIIRPTFDNATDEHFQAIIDTEVPLVTVDREVKSSYADYVGSDDEKGGRLAAQHLLGLRHKRILQITGSLGCSTFNDRAVGFEEAMVDKGLIPQTMNLRGAWEDFEKKIKLIFSKAERPTAVFCATDGIAQQIYKTLSDMGLQVPNDVSVVGYGDLDLGQYIFPNLTTISQFPHKMGVEAAKVFLDRIDSPDRGDGDRKRVLVDVELVERGSCRSLLNS
jgi:LacI family transcriptional regulator